jgi:hypothetical protein
MPPSPLSPKPPISTHLNQFWANMLTPLNAYIGTGLIILPQIKGTYKISQEPIIIVGTAIII